MPIHGDGATAVTVRLDATGRLLTDGALNPSVEVGRLESPDGAAAPHSVGA
jgi:hypothetical protein